MCLYENFLIQNYIFLSFILVAIYSNVAQIDRAGDVEGKCSISRKDGGVKPSVKKERKTQEIGITTIISKYSLGSCH